MNRDQIIEYISKPLELPAEAIHDLPELIKRYPYFQGAYILFARSLRQRNDLRFDEALKDAAVHCPDRIRLFELIHSLPETGGAVSEVMGQTEEQTLPIEKVQEDSVQDSIDKEQAHQEEPINLNSIAKVQVDTEENPAISNTLIADFPDESGVNEIEMSEELPSEQDIFNDIQNYPSLGVPHIPVEPAEVSFPVEKKQHTFFEWLGMLSSGEAEKSDTLNLSEAILPKRSKLELIEQFILTEPKISRPVKAAFFSPVSMAKRSVEDRHEIVTETLAQVYESQGNIDKAIQTYQKLSLQYPAKSSYFAALIEKLENQA